MPKGLIDTATVSQVVQCLDRGMVGQYPWSLTTVLDLTALLMRQEHMALAPGLSPPKGSVRDGQDLLIDVMLSNDLVSTLSHLDTATVKLATARSRQWISRSNHLDAVRSEVDRLLEDKRNFQQWIDWAAPQAWQAHARRLGGLFDDIYLPHVAQILGISQPEASVLHSRSNNPEELSRLIAKRDRDFEQMTRAYVASTIIRGRYHEEVARLSGLQLVRHPLRGVLSKVRTMRPVAEVRVQEAAWCLACIVLYGAVKQWRLEDRLRCWADNVSRVRRFLRRGGLQLGEGTSHAAVDAAFLVARHAGVQIVNSRLDDLLEIVFGLGIGVLSSILLSPWVGLPAGAGARFGLQKVGFPRRFRNVAAFHMRQAMLKSLPAGRIETEWTRADNNAVQRTIPAQAAKPRR